jgi:hypothetical protein
MQHHHGYRELFIESVLLAFFWILGTDLFQHNPSPNADDGSLRHSIADTYLYILVDWT